MDKIKRQVKLITTTGTTSGNTVFVADTTVTYNFKIVLTTKQKDWGLFDYIESSGVTGTTGYTTVTGVSSSRLDELRKYSTTGDLSKQFFTSTSSVSDGLNTGLTSTGLTASTYVYYIGGITYTDTIIDDVITTTFTFQSLGHWNRSNFDNGTIIKDFTKNNVVAVPEVKDDVFIIRQETSIFENQYRLKAITNISDLTYYGGGSHFNIVNNT